MIHAAFDPIDKPAAAESFVKIPEYEIQAVIPDEQSTSGKRYETYTHAESTEEEALEWVRSKPEVRRIENAERVGTVKVG